MDRAVATDGFDHYVHGLFGMGLDRLGVPFLLLGADAELLLHNGLAEVLLADGRHLVRHETGRLRCASPLSDQLIHDFLAGATAHAEAAEIFIYGPPGLAPLFASLSRFQPPAYNGRAPAPVAVVVIRAGDAEEGVAVATLLYGLSRAEAAMVRAVVAGQSLSAHAAARQVSLHTVRKQLNAAMPKAGVRTQRELQARLRDLMRGPEPARRR